MLKRERRIISRSEHRLGLLNGQGRSVLLVDDERTVLGFLQALLEQSGFNVHIATNFFDAIHLLETGDFDLLICDVGLAGQNGFDVLALARKKTCHLPAIMITGFPNDHDEQRAADQNAIYCSKPLTIEKVVNAIQTALCAGQSASAA